MEKWASSLIGWTILAKLFSLTSIILFSLWAVDYGGGFQGLSFNCHPLIMIIAFTYVYADGMLTYKLIQTPNKIFAKIVHSCINLTVLVLVGVALAPVFKGANTILYSLHSWIGIATILLYVLQWVCGFVTFLLPGLSMATRGWYKSVHRYWGMALFATAAASIITGLQSLTGSIEGYSAHSREGVMFNIIGLSVIVCVLITIYIVTNDKFIRPLTPEEEHITMEKK